MYSTEADFMRALADALGFTFNGEDDRGYQFIDMGDDLRLVARTGWRRSEKGRFNVSAYTQCDNSLHYTQRATLSDVEAARETGVGKSTISNLKMLCIERGLINRRVVGGKYHSRGYLPS